MPYPQRQQYQQRNRGGQGQHGRGSRPMKPGHIAGTLYEGKGGCMWRGSMNVQKLHDMIDDAEAESSREGFVSVRCNTSKFDGNAFLSFHGVGDFKGGEGGGHDRTYHEPRRGSQGRRDYYEDEEDMEEYEEQDEGKQDEERPTRSKPRARVTTPAATGTGVRKREPDPKRESSTKAGTPLGTAPKVRKNTDKVAWEE